MRIGIIGAMQIEVDALTAELKSAKTEKISGIIFNIGRIGSSDVVVAECGIGKVNAAICTQTMIFKYAPDYIINVGVAGGLAPELDLSGMVLASAVCQHDFDTSGSPFGDPPGLIPNLGGVNISCSTDFNEKLLELEPGLLVGVVASGDQFVASAGEGEYIAKNFGAIALDMESAAIGHACYVNQVPFLILRAISDKADGDASEEYGGNVEKAALAPIKLILGLLK